jgi:hypothetical protein
VELTFPSRPSLEVSREKWKLIMDRKLPFVFGKEKYMSVMTATFI